jgi:hypothetical protein
MAETCLHLICPSTAEDAVLDLLLSLGEAGVFTSAPAHAHGFAHGALSTAEQVSGRSGALLIHVLLPHAELGPLLQTLQRELSGSGLRYWTTPVDGAGEIQ